MMIPLVLTNNLTYYYSPDKHLFYDNNQQQIDVNTNFIPRKNPNSMDVRIVLGHQCNAKCSHCIQQFHDADQNDRLDVNTLAQEILRIKGEDRVLGGVSFWGGEPLIYIKEIQDLYYLLKDHCDPNNILGNFYIITNGIGLANDTIVDWLIETKFHTTISYDGPDSSYRQFNIFENYKILSNVKRMLQANNKSIDLMPVFSDQNDSVIKYYDNLFKLFGDDIPLVGYSNALTVMNDYTLNSLMTDSKRKNFHNETVEALINDKLSTWMEPGKRLSTFLSIYGKEDVVYCCGVVGKNTLVIDMSGNIILCHNADKTKILGHITKVNNKFPTIAEHNKNKHIDKCKQCLVYKFCSGACIIGPEEYFEYTCKDHYYYYMIFMDYLIYKITGYRLKEIPKLP